MVKTKTSTFNQLMAESTNNGILSTLTNGKENPKKENLTKDLVSLSKEISTLFLNYQITDISISSPTETWSSRLKMEERLRSGTSIKLL
jgi:hypothetical protein